MPANSARASAINPEPVSWPIWGGMGSRLRVKAVESGGTAIAGLILIRPPQEKADLMVMGGYGHSRLREMILGGVTRHMLERMSLPVLFAH